MRTRRQGRDKEGNKRERCVGGSEGGITTPTYGQFCRAGQGRAGQGRAAHPQLLRQVLEEPGVGADAGDVDAVGGVAHKHLADEVHAAGGQLQAAGEAVFDTHDPLHSTSPCSARVLVAGRMQARQAYRGPRLDAAGTLQSGSALQYTPDAAAQGCSWCQPQDRARQCTSPCGMQAAGSMPQCVHVHMEARQPPRYSKAGRSLAGLPTLAWLPVLGSPAGRNLACERACLSSMTLSPLSWLLALVGAEQIDADQSNC